MPLCVNDLAFTPLFRTAVGLFINTLIHIHYVSGRVIAYLGIIYRFVFHCAWTMPWTVVGMIVGIPVIVVAVIIMVVVRCPWLPVGGIIAIVPG
jgi:hypothetical protein